MITIDYSDLERKLRNTSAYSEGFIAGVHQGVPILMAQIGAAIIDVIGQFIDMQAAGNPAALHHIYEWGSVGGARLFEYDYSVGGNTVVFTGTTTQSGSVAPTADRPFYNKADVMETGSGVSITPYGTALVFDAGGGPVFVSRTVNVANPGGSAVVGSFQRVHDLFFNTVCQSLLSESGILSALSTPSAYAAYFAAGANGGGYGTGVTAGRAYMAQASGSIGSISL